LFTVKHVARNANSAVNLLAAGGLYYRMLIIINFLSSFDASVALPDPCILESNI
jgi:hypothetical protein